MPKPTLPEVVVILSLVIAAIVLSFVAGVAVALIASGTRF